MCSSFPMLNKFSVPAFSNLRIVTLTKRVEIEVQNLHDNDIIHLPAGHHQPLYIYVPGEWDGSSLQSNRTHFLTQKELAELDALFTWPCGFEWNVKEGFCGWSSETDQFRNWVVTSANRHIKVEFMGAVSDNIPREKLSWGRTYETRAYMT